MDFESTSDGFAILSLVTDHPFISIPCLILAAFFAYKACIFESDCSHNTCTTGKPMVVKGKCICGVSPR